MFNFKIYLKSILIPLLLGSIAGLITAGMADYQMLTKPPLAPPAILFPIVWTILYILMGVSYGILKAKRKISDDVKFIYYFQLFVNLLWPIFFFSFKWSI